MTVTEHNSKQEAAQFTIRPYAVALLDLLGQQRALASWDTIESGCSVEDAKAIMQRSVGLVAHLREALESFVNGMTEQNSVPIPANFVPSTHWEMARHFSDGSASSFTFGDTVVCFSPIEENDWMRPKPALLLAIGAAMWFRYYFAMGVPLRGSFEVGLGCDYFAKEVYGPVLASAHKLEDGANWPRIVVGAGVAPFLDRLDEPAPNGHCADVYRATADMLRRLIVSDTDGTLVLDYCNDIVEEFARGTNEQDAFSLSRVRATAVKQQRAANSEGNTGIAVKYAKMLQFIDEHASTR